MATDHERAFAFQRWVLERTSTRTETLPWGTAFFHDGFPLRYDANLAIADRPLGGTSAADVVSTLDATYAGFRHREVEFASATDADAIAMGMAEHGYAVERLLIMAMRREPDRQGDPGATEELDLEAYRPFVVVNTRTEAWGQEPGIAESMAEFRGELARGVGARFFTQRIDGEPAGACELYVRDDVAQIEDVSTLPAFRGRGVARNVVLRAAREARAAGATFVFLFADADDWPRHLYTRLGFDAIGESRLFTRFPERS
jgi:ribosomal protein S18 acetylase RimI-like enzyme